MKKGFIATAALIGIMVALEFVAPGHWSFLIEYFGKTFESGVNNFS